jgi:competence/damage-inducible protein CinA-like protein
VSPQITSSQITSAEIMAIGTELTTGATRDTNSGDLARELTALGVRIVRTTTMPDDLTVVSEAFRAALERAMLVVSTGGLGPTPDDLTREAIAAACDLETAVDPDLLAWLEELFTRRGAPMPEANRKQAWLIPGARALPNGHGSAPGWLVERPAGRVIVALPGPPREMWPMWREHALPALRQHGLGADRASHTLRLTGIGESALVPLIGEELLRGANPQVATYARAEGVDVVVSAESGGDSRAQELVERTVEALRGSLGRYVFAEGEATWAEVLSQSLAGRTLATVEMGSGGQLLALLGSSDFLLHGELRRLTADLVRLAQEIRAAQHATFGLALGVHQARDTHVRVAIASEDGVEEFQRVAFLAGPEGRQRAATVTCAALWEFLSREKS